MSQTNYEPKQIDNRPLIKKIFLIDKKNTATSLKIMKTPNMNTAHDKHLNDNNRDDKRERTPLSSKSPTSLNDVNLISGRKKEPPSLPQRPGGKNDTTISEWIIV